MKNLYFILSVVFLLSSNVYAKETKILYYKYEIPGAEVGTQVGKSYYMKDSIKKVNSNKNIIEVSTIATTTSIDGGKPYTSTYKVTYQIDCNNKLTTIVKYWSSGTSQSSNKAMVDGIWIPSADYKDSEALLKKICGTIK